MPLLFIASTIVVVAVVTFVVYSQFRSQMIQEYTRMAKGVTALMADKIDGDKIDVYFRENFSSKEYRDIRDDLYKLRDNYPDVLYIYSFRCEEDGGHMLFDINTDEVENGEAFEVGYVYQLEGEFADLIPEIMAGEQVPGYAVHTEEDGYLFSYCRPVFDSDGNYACSVCVDFSLDRLENQNRNFTFRLALGLLAIAFLILLLEVIVVRHWVTEPINKLSHCLEKFNYKSEEDRRRNVELLDELDIKSQDEIGVVYQMVRSVANDSFQSTSNLGMAQHAIEDKDKEISLISKEAYRDSLTNVGNLAAFKRDNETIDGEYALVMFDLNNLKAVNDKYGHNNGDIYIQGCSHLICREYKHSPVYRIGGDEFVVVLKDEDYENREHHFKNIKTSFAESREDAQPWERYSASVGMAVRQPGETLKEVKQRADEAMYKDKEEYKKRTGNVR